MRTGKEAARLTPKRRNGSDVTRDIAHAVVMRKRGHGSAAIDILEATLSPKKKSADLSLYE